MPLSDAVIQTWANSNTVPTVANLMARELLALHARHQRLREAATDIVEAVKGKHDPLTGSYTVPGGLMVSLVVSLQEEADHAE